MSEILTKAKELNEEQDRAIVDYWNGLFGLSHDLESPALECCARAMNDLAMFFVRGNNTDHWVHVAFPIFHYLYSHGFLDKVKEKAIRPMGDIIDVNRFFAIANIMTADGMIAWAAGQIEYDFEKEIVANIYDITAEGLSGDRCVYEYLIWVEDNKERLQKEFKEVMMDERADFEAEVCCIIARAIENKLIEWNNTL